MNGTPSTTVSPGIWGFVAFFVLALALYLLMRNMNARMRRMSYRAEELQREAEDGQRSEGGAGDPSDQAGQAGRAGHADAGQADTRRAGSGATDDGTPAQEQTEDPGQKPGTQSQS